MDTRFIEVRKNIVVSFPFNDESSFSQDINIDFIPDEVIVKLVQYDTADDQVTVSGIYSDLVSDFLASFIWKSSIIPTNLTFTLRKPIRGKYNFQLLEKNNANNLVESNVTGQLWIHLEFVKYRTDLPDKKIF